jgi:hypothetical protein
MRVRIPAVLVAIGASTLVASIPVAEAQPVKLAGMGVSRCHVFNEQIADRPGLEELYLTWAQGFMSGVLLRARPGQDDSLDLTRMTTDEQRQFLRQYCQTNPLRYYFEGVAALYHKLDGKSLDFLM